MKVRAAVIWRWLSVEAWPGCRVYSFDTARRLLRPTVTGYDDIGRAVECGEILYAQVGDRSVDCARCGGEIDVIKNQRRALANRDLMARATLLEAHNAENESVPN